MHRLSRLEAAAGAARACAACVLAFSVAAGCSSSTTGTDDDSDDTVAPVYSFEAITGEWTGTLEGPGGAPDEDGRVNITVEEASNGEKVGTASASRDGEVLCRVDLLVDRRTDPPEYWFDFEYTKETDGACVDGGTFRFEHDPAAGTLTWYWKGEDSSDYNQWGTLTRQGS